MGDVAASGGYWVSAPAEQIFAPPSAITGSIGVVGARLDVSGLAARLGIGAATEKIGAHADAESLFRPWSDDERAAELAEMQYIYDRFLDRVASGRHKSKAEVNEIGRGRVWSGAQAHARGLVDRLEGLSAALDEARRRAGLAERTRVEVISLPVERGNVIRQLLAEPEDLGARGATAVLPPPLRAAVEAVPRVVWYPRGPLARWPWAEALVGRGAGF
jgi:protease-4